MGVLHDEDYWLETYKPFQNQLDPNASWNGMMYETYGNEEDYVRQQDIYNIWTWVDGSEGGTYLVNGMAYVNRLGYFICAVPWTDGADYCIEIDMPEEPEDE